MTMRCLVLAACLCAALGRAAADSAEVLVAANDPRRFGAFLAQCRARYAEVDGRIDRARVRDAGYFPVPGYPYLRTDRLMSSYRDELDGLDKFGAWMLQLREYDSLAREDELANLGMPKAARAGLLSDLRLCAVWLSYAELDDPQTRNHLSDAARVSDRPGACDDANLSGQTPRARRQAVAADFAEAGTAAAAQLLWQPAPSADGGPPRALLREANRDELGRVGLPMDEWGALAAAYAPRLLFDGRGPADAPGMPALAGSRATVDPARPVVHYLVDYARLHHRTVVQIEYFLWFRRPGTAAVNGLIWRVTLDEQGQPLLYSSVRADGEDPLWFPARPMRPRVADAEASPQVPQTAPAGPFALRLQASTHRLIRLVSSDDGTVAQADHRDYILRPYEELLVLPDGSGGTRSLFDSRGLVRGAGSVGVCMASGAARQWGHHPILIGRKLYYFDDPRLIEKLFVVPESPERASPSPASPKQG